MPGWLALLLEPAEETWSTEAVSSDQLEGTEAVVILSMSMSPRRERDQQA